MIKKNWRPKRHDDQMYHMTSDWILDPERKSIINTIKVEFKGGLLLDKIIG